MAKTQPVFWPAPNFTTRQQVYRAGNFRTATGRTVRPFTTGTERLVLLPQTIADGTPVLLDAADPGRFAAQVHADPSPAPELGKWRSATTRPESEEDLRTMIDAIRFERF